jgi:hypothetical protein
MQKETFAPVFMQKETLTPAFMLGLKETQERGL